MICPYLSEPSYFLFAEDVPLLLYYSHLPAIAVSLLLGLLVLANGPKVLLNRLFFGIVSLFSVWALFNLITWTNIDSDTIVFVWSFFGLLYALISVLCIYFIYVFIEQRDLGFVQKLILFLLALPIIVLTPTYYNLSGFDLVLCGSSGYEGSLFIAYYTFLGILAVVWIAWLLIRKIPHIGPDRRKQALFVGVGIECFLIAFFGTGFMASYLNNIGVLNDYSLEQYGLFGMIIFMASIAFVIVQFRAFNVKVLATQALVVTILILIASEFTFVNSFANYTLVAITFILTGGVGIVLIRNVQKEIEQRERIEKLAKELAVKNEQLSEFMSLATHQIRNPATFIRGSAAMALEGSFGTLTPELRSILQRILIRANDVLHLGNQYLNKSKLELDKMTYAFVETDLGAMLKDLAHEAGAAIEQKKMTIKADIPPGDYTATTDEGKIKETLGNLIDNAIKYTPEGGAVTLSITGDANTVTMAVKDNGAGIPADVIPHLFKKFSRADAKKNNLMGTGLGLYLGKVFVEAHHGRIWVESAGQGKGSTFYLQLPRKQAAPAPTPKAT